MAAMVLDADASGSELRSRAATLSKAIQISCTTLFFYASVLNFPEEKEFIWSKRWSIGKALYILVRYLGAAFLIYVCVTEAHVPWRYIFSYGSTKDRLSREGLATLATSVNYYHGLCLHGFLYVGPGALIMFLTEGALSIRIMMMRVYALYGRSGRVFVFLCSLSFASLVYDVIQAFGFLDLIGNASSNCIGECISDDTIPYYQDCAVESINISYVGWLLLSGVELSLFAMVMWKYLQMKEYRLSDSCLFPNQDITSLIARDSAFYFAWTFVVCALGFVVNFIPTVYPLEDWNNFAPLVGFQANSYQTVAVAIMAQLAPKLLINIRREYYQMRLAERTDLSWMINGTGADS